jgi:hypothetical protein
MILSMGLMAPVAVDAGDWTTRGGTLWTKVSWFRQSTGEYNTDGDQLILLPDNTLGARPAGSRQPYRFNGQYESVALFFEGYYGITDAIDVGLQVPWFDQSFDDDTRIDLPSESGFSDTRVYARWNFLTCPFLLTLKEGVKIPSGEFKNEESLIPVGEGQADYDFVLQAGRSLWPWPAYVNADIGYRVKSHFQLQRTDSCESVSPPLRAA